MSRQPGNVEKQHRFNGIPRIRHYNNLRKMSVLGAIVPQE
jgi:hypothetical protein